MKNRSPNDNTINGIAENIAELDALPGIIIENRDQVATAAKTLSELTAVERGYSEQKIPHINRQIAALEARINMLELPVSIAAIQELVAKDAATIADAESVKAKNETDVNPHREESNKNQTAINLYSHLSSYQSTLASASSNLAIKTTELARLKEKLEDLKQRRETAHHIASTSRQRLEGLDNELSALRKRHRAEEEPAIHAVDQVKSKLDHLQVRHQNALRLKAETSDQQLGAQKAESRNNEQAKRAYRDEVEFQAKADAAHTKKRKLLAELERQHSAYESAKQAAAYSSNASSGGYSSSSNGAPPSAYSSDQGGSNSNSSYSSNVSNNGNILADLLQKITETERAIQSAEEEAEKFERKAAAEHNDAHIHEAEAASAHQLAHQFGEQSRSYFEEAASLQTDIVRTTLELQRESYSLSEKQQRIRFEDDKLRKVRDDAHQQFQNDTRIYDDLNGNYQSTSISIDATNQTISSLTSDIEYAKQGIDRTETAIKADDYASRFSRQQLEVMRDEQIKLAQPYLNKIEECNIIIKNTSTQKKAKENDIEALEKKLRIATATVDQSTNEFADICTNQDVPNLQKQLGFAITDKEDLQQQLNAQRTQVRSKQTELDHLRRELENNVRREQSLKSGILLMRLYRDPENELNSLHADLSRAVTAYAESHHAGLNWQTRSSFLNIANRADFILHNHDVEGKTDNDKLRNKFYQLSGLIRNEMEFVNGNPSYFGRLANLLHDRDIAERNVYDIYRKLEVKYPQPLHIMTYDEITQYDADQYRLAKQAFDDLLARGPEHHDGKWRSFYQAGKNISSCIHKEEVKVRKVNEPAFDVHLHTRIFQLAATVLQHPENALARTELHELTHDNKVGKPSTPRKVIGAILAFIGAAAALVGGLALASLLPVISLPIAAPMIAVGGVGVVTGLFTFFSGVERGLSKAYSKFDNLSADIGSHLPAAPAPAPSAPLPDEYFDSPNKPTAPSMDKF